MDMLILKKIYIKGHFWGNFRQCLIYPQNGGNFRQIFIDYSNGINNN